jgi:hypothetical protein
MTAPTRNWWPVLLALGVGFTFLNFIELVFLDGGWPQIVGVVFGCGLVAVGIARQRGWTGVGR